MKIFVHLDTDVLARKDLSSSDKLVEALVNAGYARPVDIARMLGLGRRTVYDCLGRLKCAVHRTQTYGTPYTDAADRTEMCGPPHPESDLIKKEILIF